MSTLFSAWFLLPIVSLMSLKNWTLESVYNHLYKYPWSLCHGRNLYGGLNSQTRQSSMCNELPNRVYMITNPALSHRFCTNDHLYLHHSVFTNICSPTCICKGKINCIIVCSWLWCPGTVEYPTNCHTLRYILDLQLMDKYYRDASLYWWDGISCHIQVIHWLEKDQCAITGGM